MYARDLTLSAGLALCFHGSLFFGIQAPPIPESPRNSIIIEPTAPEAVIEPEPEDPAEAESEAEPETPEPVYEFIPESYSPDARPDVPTMVVPRISTLRPPDGVRTVLPPITRMKNKNYGDPEGAYRIEELDAPLAAKFQPSPVYPPELKRLGQSGRVVVEFVVDTRGRVRDCRVTESTHSEFTASVVQAVSKWRFDPPIRKGKAVGCRVRQVIPFALRNES